MFWNDPNLYGATFPYQDFAIQQNPFMAQFLPWQKYVPQIHAPGQYLPQYTPYFPFTGFQPQPYGMHYQQYQPYLQFGQTFPTQVSHLPQVNWSSYGMLPWQRQFGQFIGC